MTAHLQSSGGSQPLSVLRSGVLNAVDVPLGGSQTFFEGDLPAGTVVVKAWALISLDLNWNSGSPRLQLVVDDVVSLGFGCDLVTYDLSSGFPDAAGDGASGRYEFTPLDNSAPHLALNESRSGMKTGDAKIEAAFSDFGDGFTVGTYEIFALILAAT